MRDCRGLSGGAVVYKVLDCSGCRVEDLVFEGSTGTGVAALVALMSYKEKNYISESPRPLLPKRAQTV